MFVITISNLRISTILGVYDWEKEKKREVILNIKLVIKNNDSFDSDNLNDTVDYNSLSQQIIERSEKMNFNLIERLVAAIGRDILAFDPKIHSAILEAIKVGAVKGADSVGVWTEFKR